MKKTTEVNEQRKTETAIMWSLYSRHFGILISSSLTARQTVRSSSHRPVDQ